MTRKQLLNLICDVHPCVDFELFFNNWLDKYDKHVIEQYKADTNLKDTIREIHDNVAKEMYCKGIDDVVKALITMYERYDIDDVFESSDTYSYTSACCIFEDYIREIAEELKSGDKNEN